jgi:hypothetical protein
MTTMSKTTIHHEVEDSCWTTLTQKLNHIPGVLALLYTDLGVQYVRTWYLCRTLKEYQFENSQVELFHSKMGVDKHELLL